MIVLAIDPGSTRSAWCGWDSVRRRTRGFGIWENERLLATLRAESPLGRFEAVVIEKVSSYGMAVGAEVFETVYWTGRFAEASSPIAVDRIFRKTVVAHICHSAKAKDPEVRQALIDLFGGDLGKAAAIGTKAAPGPLYGISKDVWSALAIGVAYGEGARSV